MSLSSCSGGGQGDLRPEKANRDSRDVAPEHPAPGGDRAVPPPADRPIDSVRTALRRLDACALVDKSVAAASGMVDKLWVLPDTPHSCVVTNKPLIGNQITVRLGYPLNRHQRYRNEPITVGAAKAYLDRSELPSRCRIDLPVSQGLSVQFQYELAHDTTGDPCGKAKAFAEAGARLLAGGEVPAVDTGRRPLGDWDACTLLRQAMGTDAERFTITESGVYALDSCTSTPKEAGVPRRGIDLEIRYTTDPMAGPGVVTRAVNSKQARVGTYPSSCKLDWSQGASGLGGTLNGFTVVTLKADTCDTAAGLAAKIEALLGSGPAPGGPEPLKRLLYAPEEPDSPAAGACVDFPTDESIPCKPYDSLKVPETIQAVLDGSDDPRMGCALAMDAVKEVLGESFRPVVWGKSCFFVEPTHTSLLRIDVDATFVAQKYGDNPKLYADRRVVDVAGKPAVTFTSGGGQGKPATEYAVYVAPKGDVAGPGIVAGRFEARPARGSASNAVPDTGKLPLLDQVMSRIVASRLVR
ncbi:hypothetical protein [Embleya sp. NPDC001921]